MMKTEYRGYEIRYSENMDEWVCDVVKRGSATLSAMRAKIDKLHLELRKAASVDAYELDTMADPPALTEARVVGYKKGTARHYLGEHVVAVIAKRRGNERAARREVSLDNIIASTPDVQEKMAALAEKNAALRIAQKAVQAAIADLPRLHLDDIAGLIAASESRLEEGDAA